MSEGTHLSPNPCHTTRGKLGKSPVVVAGGTKGCCGGRAAMSVTNATSADQIGDDVTFMIHFIHNSYISQ